MTLTNALINSGSAEDLQEALEIVAEMKERVSEGEDPDEVLRDYGLEPDYFLDLLD